MTRAAKEHPSHPPVPVLELSREDVLYSKPDLEERVGPLDEATIGYLAGKLGDALQEDYWLALGIVIEAYLRAAGKEDDDVV